MPGSGKSFLGKPLAEAMNVPYLDMDPEIEAKEGKTISEIFSSLGENYFRKLEAAMLRALSANHQNAVISTGGGAPCFHHGMDFINENGTSVFLVTDKEVLLDRLSRKSHRPLMQGDIGEKTDDLLKTRLPIYQQAHLAISHRDVSSLIESIQTLKS